MEDENVLRLAENLRKNGLSSSDQDALNKAKMMLGMSFASKPVPEASQAEPQEAPKVEPKDSLQTESPQEAPEEASAFDITQDERPLNEIMDGHKEPIEMKKMPVAPPEFEQPQAAPAHAPEALSSEASRQPPQPQAAPAHAPEALSSEASGQPHTTVQAHLPETLSSETSGQPEQPSELGGKKRKYAEDEVDLVDIFKPKN